MDSCSWSNLPRELTDRVFRRNNINSKDLTRCSLVCTTWRLVIADIWGKNFSLLRTANTGATRRIVWDYKNFHIETFKGCKAELVDSLFHWEAIMIGPKDTPYADGVFLLKIYLSPGHPFQHPKVKFLTKVYHPNIGRDGRVCVEKSWRPSLTIFQLLLVIYARFSNPEPDDPIDCEIAQMYKTQRIQYDENARDWTKKYATASQEGTIDWSRFLKNNNILEPTKLVD
ncbi:ubiquitin-conjugating enzyme E2 11-like isoform X2 [Quercus robur]|uniref:ubiquitin-conjugating enzyme E2 11-like isoform X2 n=2 Tax=Quercus robur TaxID=38942 RepID=UPI002162135F|nr:ubiquitin-conjugating enzyme E2 11-like isoform X2 [Quercus robur]